MLASIMSEGALLGVEHLIQKGYHKIGMLAGFQRLSTMVQQFEGYRQALQTHGLPLREEWVVHSPLSIEGGKQAMQELLALPDVPGTLFCQQPIDSGALLVMKSVGLRCQKTLPSSALTIIHGLPLPIRR